MAVDTPAPAQRRRSRHLVVGADSTAVLEPTDATFDAVPTVEAAFQNRTPDA
jgi:hypothetical protein